MFNIQKPAVYVYMWANYRPPVYKLVIQFLNLLASFQLYVQSEVVLFRYQVELFESWPNSWKLAESYKNNLNKHESSSSLPNR